MFDSCLVWCVCLCVCVCVCGSQCVCLSVTMLCLCVCPAPQRGGRCEGDPNVPEVECAHLIAGREHVTFRHAQRRTLLPLRQRCVCIRFLPLCLCSASACAQCPRTCPGRWNHCAGRQDRLIAENALESDAVFTLPIQESIAAANDNGVPMLYCQGQTKEDDSGSPAARAAVPVFHGSSMHKQQMDAQLAP